jgi:hypothetical protein
VIACAAVGIAVTTRRCLETDEARAQRAERNRKRELRALADKISTYGGKVHQRYPSGGVVVSEHDLAGKSPEGSAERILEAERVIKLRFGLARFACSTQLSVHRCES